MSLQEMTLRRALELAVTTEELGCQYYRALAKRFADQPDIANVFSNLAMDESAHEAEFQTLLSKVAEREAKVDEVMGDEEAYQVLRAASLSQFFEQGALADVSDVKTPEDALTKAVDFEKSTLLYYVALKDALGDSPELAALVTAEKNHVATLMRVLLSQSQFRGIRDTRSQPSE